MDLTLDFPSYYFATILHLGALFKSQQADFSHLLQDIKLVLSLFSEVNFGHAKRLENNIAHKLTRRARPHDSTLIRIESVHLDIYDVYNNNLLMIDNIYPFRVSS